MDAENRRYLPDVHYVALHHGAGWWANGTLPDLYRFRVTGKPWGARWVVHSVYADRPAPAEWRLRNMAALKAMINLALSELLEGKEIPHWENSLLSWEDE